MPIFGVDMRIQYAKMKEKKKSENQKKSIAKIDKKMSEKMASKRSEKQPLIIENNNMPSSNLAGEKPPWNSYKTHPEVKHELILYGELAAAAAFIVGLYVLCLLPWEYIHRADMIASRLHPFEVSMDNATKILENCQNAVGGSLNDTIAYKLTKHPCGTEPLSTRLRDYKLNFGCKTKKERFQGQPKTKYVNAKHRYSYHDLIDFFHFECCTETAEKCPCGYNQTFSNKCYAWIKSEELPQFQCNIMQNYSTELQPFLNAYDPDMSYCKNGERYYLNGTEVSCNEQNLIFFDGNNNKLNLCELESDEHLWWK